tara:strand:+ start:5762 stop:6100 length:339 start_codon:yes stop_codon:yes gene_type:complete
MKSINKVILIGHLGAKPEGRYTQQGISTATFSLATNEVWMGADNKKHEHTEWHHIVVWNKLADFVTQYLDKGHLVYIEGAIKTRSWIDKNNEQRKVIEIMATQVVSLEKTKM